MSSSSPPSLAERLKQRKLVQWGLAYLAGAWVALQVLGQVAQSFDWPSWIMRLATVSLAFGLLPLLVVAYYHGERGEQRVSGPELVMLAMLFLIGGILIRKAAPVQGSTSATATNSPSVSASDRRTIAVLPFQNLSDETGDEYLAQGLQNEIITQLTASGALRVIGEGSDVEFASRNKPAREFVLKLGAGSVLQATVQRSGTRVRVNAQLIDARTDEHIWAESYDQGVKDLFAVQRRIAQSIARALQVRLGAGNTVPGQVSPEAYDLYLRGQYEASKPFNEATNRRALDYYRRAVTIDSSFAPAHADLARALASTYMSLDAGPRRVAEADAEARRAIDLDSTLPGAYIALGMLATYAHRDYAAAERAHRRSLELDPTSPDALARYGRFLRFTGRFEEAIRALERAVSLDPTYLSAWDYLGGAYLVAGRYDEAEAVPGRREAAGLSPASGALVLVYIARRRFAEARALAAQNPGVELQRGLPALVAAAEGRRDEARLLLADRGDLALSSAPSAARIYATLGERDSAFVWLDRWASQAYMDPRGSPFDPGFTPLHDDPRWTAFLTRIGLR